MVHLETCMYSTFMWFGQFLGCSFFRDHSSFASPCGTRLSLCLKCFSRRISQWHLSGCTFLGEVCFPHQWGRWLHFPLETAVCCVWVALPWGLSCAPDADCVSEWQDLICVQGLWSLAGQNLLFHALIRHMENHGGKNTVCSCLELCSSMLNK